MQYSTVIQLYIYVPSFSYSFPLWFSTGFWIYFPVLYGRTLITIHSIYNGLHLPVLNSQPLSLPPLPPSWQPQICFLCKTIIYKIDGAQVNSLKGVSRQPVHVTILPLWDIDFSFSKDPSCDVLVLSNSDSLSGRNYRLSLSVKQLKCKEKLFIRWRETVPQHSKRSFL